MKGFVFSLDAMIGVFVFIMLLPAIFHFIQEPKQSYVGESNSVLIASDIMSVLDAGGILDTLDESQISDSLNSYLPSNLNMSITLNIYKDDLSFQETKQVNTDLTGNHFLGKWLYIVGNLTDVKNYVMAEYKVGFK